MSFRLRVLLMIVFLVATSSAATAWLTMRQASRELTDSVAASRRDVELATRRLAEHGHLHGGWDEVNALIVTLSAELGQRVRIDTEADEVVADSDVLTGHTARALPGAPSLVDARPPLDLTYGGTAPYNHYRLMLGAVDSYERSQIYAACLSRAGVPVRTGPGKGFPLIQPVGDDSTEVGDQAGCRFPPSGSALPKAVDEAGKRCVSRTDDKACLQQVFADAIRPYAPAQLRLYLGARDEVPHQLSTGTVAIAAGVVIIVAVLSALLLSRRVLRPIGALTAASHRLGSGDLAGRVPVTGRDELADLARTFNRMAESLARSEEQQRRLIGDVAHELRTPLANLRGYLEALKDGVIAPSPELFASLHEEALLQQRIVDDLQELALAEAGSLAYHRGAVDLAELAETCRAAHLALAERAGVRLTVTAEPAAVVGDSDRLRQVLSNLIRNALAATGAGGTIRIAVRVLGERAFVEVADTGHGIAAADLPHLFDRLWRADAARARATGGSGLGLAIAREIVAAHGGRIRAASEPGAGAVFTVELPLDGSLSAS